MTDVRPLAFSSEQALAPGRYRRDGFVPPASFEVSDAWFAMQDVPGFFDIQRDPGSPDVIAVQFARPSGVGSADELLADLQGRRDLLVGAPTPVLVGGQHGLALVVDASDPNATAGRFVPVLAVDAGPISIATGRRLEVILVDRPEGLLAVLIGGSVRGWEAARAIADPVVASIRFA